VFQGYSQLKYLFGSPIPYRSSASREPKVSTGPAARGMDSHADRQLLGFKSRSHFPPSHVYFTTGPWMGGPPDKVAFKPLPVSAVAGDANERVPLLFTNWAYESLDGAATAWAIFGGSCTTAAEAKEMDVRTVRKDNIVGERTMR